MPVLGIVASSISGNLYSASYESISTVTVGSGGTSTVTFSSIPSNYTHLQMRILAQTNRTTYGRDGMNLRINGNASTLYAYHYLIGDGAAVGSAGVANTTFIRTPEVATSTAYVRTFGTIILDLLDYSTAKNKTVRMLGGADHDGTVAGLGAQIELSSGLFINSDPVTSLTFTPAIGTLFSENSSFALYGIKGVV